MKYYVAEVDANTVSISRLFKGQEDVITPKHPENLTFAAAKDNVRSLIENEIGELQKRLANLWMALEVLPDEPQGDGYTVWEYVYGGK